jgi:hypothetical protein
MRDGRALALVETRQIVDGLWRIKGDVHRYMQHCFRFVRKNGN